MRLLNGLIRHCFLIYFNFIDPCTSIAACYNLTVEYLRWDSVPALCALVFAIIGIIFTLCTAVVFMRFNATPVVKATTRELSYIILAGILLCYFTTFILILKPNKTRCIALRIIPWLAFAMMYGALLTKTNRIARILAGSKKRILTKKPRFLSTTSQVMITCIIVAMELSITIAILLYRPANETKDFNRYKRVLLICNTQNIGILVPFGFDFFLIALCTLYAVKTRNLPENFNEAKFIGFTMYTTCIIWLGFVTIYFGSDSKSITMCLCFSLSATVALVLLFIPKIYIILLRPDRNVRSAYATTKVIRCHIGTAPSQASVAHESFKYSGVKSLYGSSKSPESSISGTSLSESDLPKKRIIGGGSIHVPNPQAKKKHVGIAGEEIEGTQITENLYIPSSRHASTAMKAMHTFSGRVPELSIIEESLPSQTESGANRSQICAEEKSKFSDVGSQTDNEFLEKYLRAWLMSGKAEKELRRRSYSTKTRGPRESSTVVDSTSDETESSETQFGTISLLKRTLSEYGRIASRVKGHGRRHKGEQRYDQTIRRTGGSTLSLYSAARLSTSSQSSSPVHSRSHSKLSQIEYFFDSEKDVNAERQISPEELKTPTHVSGEKHVDLIGKSLGSTFQAFFSTAVPVDQEQQFFICSDEAVPEIENKEGNSTSPKKSPTSKRTSSNEDSTPDSSPKLDRSGSIFTKLGYSLRKRIRRGKPTVGAGLAGALDLSSSSRCDDDKSSHFLNESYTPEPTETILEEEPEISSIDGGHQQEDVVNLGEHLPLRSGCSVESDAADSGFLSSRPSDKMTSFDSAQSSKHGSEKSKRGSVRTEIKERGSPTSLIKNIFTGNTSSKTDDQKGGGNNVLTDNTSSSSERSFHGATRQELQELMHTSGIEIELSSTSTVV